MQVFDRYGRGSNIVKRNLLIKTGLWHFSHCILNVYFFSPHLAVLMYTSAKPVKITSSAAHFSMNVGFEIYESPIKKLYTNITTSDAIDISGRI